MLFLAVFIGACKYLKKCFKKKTFFFLIWTQVYSWPFSSVRSLSGWSWSFPRIDQVTDQLGEIAHHVVEHNPPNVVCVVHPGPVALQTEIDVREVCTQGPVEVPQPVDFTPCQRDRCIPGKQESKRDARGPVIPVVHRVGDVVEEVKELVAFVVERVRLHP